MVLIAIYSTFSSAYFASTGVPELKFTKSMALVTELLFALDMILNFCSQFYDHSQNLVLDIRIIA
jgi:hypothetical protein